MWPVLTAITFIPALVHLGLFFTAESPKYLFINRNDKIKAEEGLFFLISESDIKKFEVSFFEKLSAEKV